MLSQLAHHTTAILRRSRFFAPWPPSTLGAFHFSPIFRGHSWTSRSQPANWSYLNDIYSKAVDVKPKETLLSPEERWAVQSRTRLANLTPPKGPYAGRSVEVKNGNVADALNKLQTQANCRHEKKGYKRRRLSSQRWRRRFAHEVRKKVQLVNKIRARGA
ncbi:hypothetical protein BC826DRAFT_986609 [Russula brevipes]|nr:hypothetical protein BC826DRAFT_986609 [Russula brevipes]